MINARNQVLALTPGATPPPFAMPPDVGAGGSPLRWKIGPDAWPVLGRAQAIIECNIRAPLSSECGEAEDEINRSAPRRRALRAGRRAREASRRDREARGKGERRTSLPRVRRQARRCQRSLARGGSERPLHGLRRRVRKTRRREPEHRRASE